MKVEGVVASQRGDHSPWPVFAAVDALRSGFPNSSAADLSWVSNAYAVVYAAWLVPASRLADALGRKRVFQGAALVSGGLRSLRCGAFGGRACGRAGFPGSRRCAADACIAVTGARCISCGRQGRRRCDGLALGLLPEPAAGLVGLVARVQPAQRMAQRQQRRVARRRGCALIIAGVGALAYGIVQGDSQGWRSPGVVAALVAGPLLLAAFVAWARRIPNPAVDLTLFADRTYRYVNLATLVFGIAFSLMVFAMFFFPMQVWHCTLPQAGLAVSPGSSLVVPVAMVSGRLAARIGHRPLLLVGSLLYGAGGLRLYLRVGTSPDDLGVWLPGLMMTGPAVGMVLPSLRCTSPMWRWH